ncbi:McrB family protein [Hymenobacter setariae]|nr:AAA family ATPase [Hymenobacter setariae]
MTTNQPVAYLLGAYWYDNDPRDQTNRFVQHGIWENGYDTEYLDLVKSIAVGSPVFIKSLFYHNGLKTSVLRVKARGVVTANQGDGQHLTVNWDKVFTEEDLTERAVPGVGRYWDTVERVTEPSHLDALFHTPQPPDKLIFTFPLNQILYGPPGTGKTFSTSALTLAILTGQSWADINGHYGHNHAALRQGLEAYREQGQTAFVTFHQAFGYEDFVEGIKPYEKENDQLGYRVEDGVFKRMCRTARQAWQAAITGQSAPAALRLAAADFDELYEAFADDLRNRLAQGSHPQLVTRQGMPVEVIAVDEDGTLTLIHLNSTHGATYKHRVAPKWIRQIFERYSSVAEIQKVYEELRQLGGPNASLQWAIFNGLKNYEQLLPAPSAAPEADTPPQATEIPRFVLVIDEINRGNVANIFGELITLLEDDKRTGEANEITVTLPYSKQSFSVPPNLYLLGTMNTADRSVEALDTALRRRFSFTEMRPEPRVIREQVGDNGVLGTGDEAVDVARLLEVLNSRLEQLLDHDHCLGHALLLRVADVAGLRAAFQRNILPLLQEYFFGDWGKIGLVLGERFVAVADKAAGRAPLAKFGGYDATGLRDKPLYRLTKPESWDAAAFRSIYATT